MVDAVDGSWFTPLLKNIIRHRSLANFFRIFFVHDFFCAWGKIKRILSVGGCNNLLLYWFVSARSNSEMWRFFMRKKSRLFLLIVLLLQLLLLSALAADPWRIVVQSSPLRQSPQVFGKIIAPISYGTEVDVLGERAGWLQVKVAGKSGWLHKTAVTRRPLSLSAGDKPVAVAASKSELSLAGKGFNQQVENAYRDKNAQLDYAWVDRMAQFISDEDQLRQFVIAGGLKGAGHAN